MQGEKIKVTLSLNVEALGLLESLVTERKRGEFVSGLILAYAAQQQQAMHSDRSLNIAEIVEHLRELASLLAKVNQPQPTSWATHTLLRGFIDGKRESHQRS